MSKIDQKAVKAYFDAIAAEHGGYSAIWERCRAEYSHEIAKRGPQGGMAQWLAGCALPELEIWNDKILALAYSWGWKPTAKTAKGIETQESKIIENWFSFAAMATVKGGNIEHKAAFRAKQKQSKGEG